MLTVLSIGFWRVSPVSLAESLLVAQIEHVTLVFEESASTSGPVPSRPLPRSFSCSKQWTFLLKVEIVMLTRVIVMIVIIAAIVAVVVIFVIILIHGHSTLPGYMVGLQGYRS